MLPSRWRPSPSSCSPRSRPGASRRRRFPRCADPRCGSAWDWAPSPPERIAPLTRLSACAVVRVSVDDDVRVSTIELFFDLVFVFTITQLTTLLVAEPTGVGVGRVVLIFGNVWWMYGGYAWLTNAVPPREPVVRLLMLVGMAGFLIVALAIPLAFGSSGVAFGVGYL